MLLYRINKAASDKQEEAPFLTPEEIEEILKHLELETRREPRIQAGDESC